MTAVSLPFLANIWNMQVQPHYCLRVYFLSRQYYVRDLATRVCLSVCMYVSVPFLRVGGGGNSAYRARVEEEY